MAGEEMPRMVKWFIYDLKQFIKEARRMCRHKSYLALTPPQRENLANTHQELIDELGKITTSCLGQKEEG